MEAQPTPDCQCYPITVLPHTSALFRDDYTDARGRRIRSGGAAVVPGGPVLDGVGDECAGVERGASRAAGGCAEAGRLRGFGAGRVGACKYREAARRSGGSRYGQQVALFGGPLLTLLKAATAIRKAQDATRESGREHVPVFWLATEDHDLAEVDQVALLSKTSVETLRLGLSERAAAGGWVCRRMARDAGASVLEQASELLGWGPVAELLRECYTPEATLAEGFGRLLTRVFAAQGLVVMDASTREFHALGAPVLRAAIEDAPVGKCAAGAGPPSLRLRGYHAQVLVVAGHSLLFLIDAETGARVPLRRGDDGAWKAGAQLLRQRSCWRFWTPSRSG